MAGRSLRQPAAQSFYNAFFDFKRLRPHLIMGIEK
jgi:hypothetical protein